MDKGYRTRKRSSEVNYRIGRGQNGEFLQNKYVRDAGHNPCSYYFSVKDKREKEAEV